MAPAVFNQRWPVRLLMTISTAVLALLLLPLTATRCLADDNPDNIRFIAPRPYQVIQREGFVPQLAHTHHPGGPALGFADVAVTFDCSIDPAIESTTFFEHRLVLNDGAAGRATEWTILNVIRDTNVPARFNAQVRIDAGGWYQMELRARVKEKIIATGRVQPFGVGEVFLIAGQSYATNTNDEKLSVTDPLQRLSAFHHRTSQWQLADDPQPAGDHSDGGSIWPPFGDLLAPVLKVPIGLVNLAVGGTSSAEWMPDGELHQRLRVVGSTIGRFRAVLWQQGESDVISGTSSDAYIQNLKTIRQSAVDAWRISPPWFLARSTLHPTVYNDAAGEGRIRRAIGQLCSTPGFLPGPDTDLLDGANRGDANSRRHFTGLGQRNAAAMWFSVVLPYVLQPRPEHEAVLRNLPDLHLLQPSWKSAVVHRESSVLLQADADGPPVARLAFEAAEILKVTSADRSHVFAELADFTIADDKRSLIFKSQLPVAAIRRADLFPPKDSPDSYQHRVGHPDQNLLYRPGRWFHDHDVEITYRRKIPASGTDSSAASDSASAADTSAGRVAATANRYSPDQLPGTIAKLQAGQPVRIGISGDSISTGLDASGLSATAPFQLGYPDLVAAQLQAKFNAPISLANRAVSGWSVANGLQDLDALLQTQPHLIVIAYGMNDVGRRDPAWFREQTQLLLARIHHADPAIEVILVAPMLGNSEWVHTPREMFAAYRDELLSLTGPGVALADLTEVWALLLQNKHDLDLTGNGLNHPNDFGHRLYAQAMLSLLVTSGHGTAN